MHGRKLVLFFSALLLFGCLGVMQQPQPDPYEIFSNIPTNNAKAVVYVKFTEAGIKEMQDVFGTFLTGNSLKRSQEGEAAVVIYNDSFALVSYTKTNMSIQEVIDQANSSAEESGGRETVSFETKSIGGRDITIAHVESGSIKMPVCFWKEGDTLKTVMAFGMSRYALESSSVGSTGSPLVGYALNSMGEIPTYSETNNTCDVILQSKYDTSGVKELLKESEDIKKGIPVSGTFFGEMKMYMAVNESMTGSIYGSIFGDDDADHLVFAGRMSTSAEQSNLCYAQGSNASIVKSDGKEACMIEGGGMLLTINLRFIVLQRSIGNYSVGMLSYVKGSKDVVREKAKNVIFSVNLPGQEGQWTDKAKVKVQVYDENYYSIETVPIADARVDLFKTKPYQYSQYPSYAQVPGEELLQTTYTNANGAAEFDDVAANETMFVVASKKGYRNSTGYIYSYSSPVTVYMTKMAVTPVYTESNYTESSATTNVTIDEASLSKVQIISSGGSPLVKIVVGDSGTGRDVKAAGNIAAMIGNRAYKKVNVTAALSNPHCTPAQCVCIPSVQTADVPLKLDTSAMKLVMLDSEAPLTTTLIAVGHPQVNTITADTIKNTNLALGYSGDYIAQAVGTNRIIIAGYTKADTAAAANNFIAMLTAGGPIGGAVTFSNTQIISADGTPQVKIIVGEQSSAEDSVEAANIAATIGNFAYSNQQLTAAYSGGTCIPSLSYASVMVPLNLSMRKLVVLDADVDPSANIIAIGSPDVNTITNQAFAAGGLSVEKGSAIVKAVGDNRIVIAGGTEMDTERAADRFIEWFAAKYS